MMRIENGDLIIQKHDFDHIMSWSDNEIPSEAFKEGLEIELGMSGYDPNQKFKRIILELE